MKKVMESIENMNNLNTTYIDNIVKDSYGKPLYPGDLVIVPNKYTGLKKYLYIGVDAYFDGEDIIHYKKGACYKIGQLIPEEEDERREFVCKYKEIVYAKRKEDDINEAFKEGCIGIRGKDKRYVYYNLGNYTCMEDCTTGEEKPCTVYLRVSCRLCIDTITKDTPKFIRQLLSDDKDTVTSLDMQKIYSYFCRYGSPSEVWDTADISFRSIRCPYPVTFIICDRNKPLRISKLLKENSFTVYNKEITIHVGESTARSKPVSSAYGSEICDALSNLTWEMPQKAKAKHSVESLYSKNSTWLDNLKWDR